MDSMNANLLDFVKSSLWEGQAPVPTREIYAEMKKHTIHCLPAGMIMSLPDKSDLIKEWRNAIFQQISFNAQCQYIQRNLPLSVPYVILKGTTASKYYPHPEYRSLGDIDVMTRREDFDTAYQELLNDGYRVCKTEYREIVFEKNGFVIDFHRYFGSFNKPEQVKYLDDLIIDNINESHVLPDMINGLVLLEHFNQHLEEGIGLRQTIDWMMFVYRYLDDEKWKSFREMAKKLDMEKLAIAATRMCEIYLGLPQRRWCETADENLCAVLMDYILACGNFGNKRTGDRSVGTNFFYFVQSSKTVFSLLQTRGLENWKAAQKYTVLKPFAWIYQAFRYLFRGLIREDAPAKLKEEYKEAKRRTVMFDALGVKRNSKGLVAYIDGRYVKR